MAGLSNDYDSFDRMNPAGAAHRGPELLCGAVADGRRRHEERAAARRGA